MDWLLFLIEVLALAAVFLAIFDRLKALRMRLIRQQRLLLAIGEKLGVEAVVLEQELSGLVERGERKQALARVREALGLSEPEAQDYLDTL